MPKKARAKKNSKNGRNVLSEKRKLLMPDSDGQTLGFIEKALGCRFYTVSCVDGKKRRCKARSKRLRINIADLVLVSLRDFDDKNADIIHRYTKEEPRQFVKLGLLPSDSCLETMEDDDIGIIFDDAITTEVLENI